MRWPLIQTALPGPLSAAEILRQEQLLSPSSTRDYPLVIDHGSGVWLTDLDGNEFLDACAGIAVCTSGHCHPRIVEAIERQAHNLIHMSGTDFYYKSQGELAQRLSELVPIAGPQRMFFGNSGTEVVEGAIKLARYATRRSHLIAFSGGFHGRTYGALSLTNSKLVQRQHFGPLLPEVSHVSFPGREGITPADTFREFAELFRRRVDPQDVAAVIVEPIQGEGGYVIPPPGFFSELRALCDEHDILLIADEIQTGIGRTGKFCALEHWGVQADIVCLAKGIASGLPLGVFVSRADLMRWPPGSHGNTFGGNPIACAAAIVTLDLLQEGLQASTVQRGEYLLSLLQQMSATVPELTGARGLGLMAAIDLPTREQRNQLLHACFHRGLVLLGAGVRTVRWSPPLVINDEELLVATQIFQAALEDLRAPAMARAG